MPELETNHLRLCLFGGTFDPIHSAHLRIAGEAVRHFGLDRILFIPAGMPPHKTAGVSPYDDRFRMVEIACLSNPAFQVSRLEEVAGRSYTIDTVRRFRAQMDPATELYFLIGADAFNDIETWHGWEELIRLIEFIVVTRPGGAYKVPAGATVHRLNGLELPVSSSAIRRRIAAGKPTPELPPEVRAFIDQRGLYRPTKRAGRAPAPSSISSP